MPFEFNYKYYFCISYRKDLDLHSKLKTAEKLFFKLQKLIVLCQQNLYYTQKL